MLRGCLFSLCLFVGLIVAYWYWLDQKFDAPGAYIGAGVAAFATLCAIGALMNAWTAAKDRRLLAAARHDLPPSDGSIIAVAGTIHPLHSPVISPFSGEECVLCEYDVSFRGPRMKNQSSEPMEQVAFSGFLMNPCAVHTKHGQTRILGFPDLQAIPAYDRRDFKPAKRALNYLRRAKFEDLSGVKLLGALSHLKEVWTDDDGLVSKHVRMRNDPSGAIFSPALDAYLDNPPRRPKLPEPKSPDGSPLPKKPKPPIEDESPYDDPALHDEDDEDAYGEYEDDLRNDDDDDDGYDADDDYAADDDDAGEHVQDPEYQQALAALHVWEEQRATYYNQLPKVSEKIIQVGAEVVVIGRYDGAHGGLVPAASGAGRMNRLIPGKAEDVEKKLRSSMHSHFWGGLVALAVIHVAIYGAGLLFEKSPAHRQEQQRAAEEAVRQNDVSALMNLVTRGFDINSRDARGQTLLAYAQEPQIVAYLIGQKIDVNAPFANGMTPLMDAAHNNRPEIARQLIAAGANLNARHPAYRTTALMMADSSENPEIAAMLRAAGAEDDVVTAENGQPLPDDGGPPLAACVAYLNAVHAGDKAALKSLAAATSPGNFDDVDFAIWSESRPREVHEFVGYFTNDRATLTLQGPAPTGFDRIWSYQVVNENGQWKVLRENWITESQPQGLRPLKSSAESEPAD